MNSDVLFKAVQSPEATITQSHYHGAYDETVLPKWYTRYPMSKNITEKRAEGGVGLIITEGTTVNHRAASSGVQIPCFHGEALEGWEKVVKAVHAAGGKIAPQLWHVGSIRKPGEGPYPDYASATPSGLLGPDKKVLEPLSTTRDR